jgi:hypothetical protein
MARVLPASSVPGSLATSTVQPSAASANAARLAKPSRNEVVTPRS